MTVREAAARLGVQPQAVRHRIIAGRLGATMVTSRFVTRGGRTSARSHWEISEEQLREYIAIRRVCKRTRWDPLTVPDDIHVGPDGLATFD